MADPLDTALDLMRRLPASSIQSNIDKLISLCPDLAEELITLIDRPLQIRHDHSPNGNNKEFLACDYNRDGESWRSPWSSVYQPPLQDGTQPSEELRGLEIKANHAFDSYRQLYVFITKEAKGTKRIMGKKNEIPLSSPLCFRKTV